jgi:hypothetical protein
LPQPHLIAESEGIFGDSLSINGIVFTPLQPA